MSVTVVRLDLQRKEYSRMMILINGRIQQNFHCLLQQPANLRRMINLTSIVPANVFYLKLTVEVSLW